MKEAGQPLMSRNWTELIRPRRMEVDESTHTPFYGKFVCEPLERGFGITLGNSLRRVLLSSLQGAAITSVKVDGVLHEFSTVPGVKEDVTDLTLNLKQIRLKLYSDQPKTVRPHRSCLQRHGSRESQAIPRKHPGLSFSRPGCAQLVRNPHRTRGRRPERRPPCRTRPP